MDRALSWSAVKPVARGPMTTREPKPSAAMSRSMQRFIVAPDPGSVGSGQRLGRLDRKLLAVQFKPSRSRLGAQQLDEVVVVNVALPEQGALRVLRLQRLAFLGRVGLRIDHRDLAAGQLDIVFRRADYDHRGRVRDAGRRLSNLELHPLYPPHIARVVAPRFGPGGLKLYIILS